MMKKTRWHNYLLMGLFAVLLYFPVFHHLGWEPIHNWDESLYAMRAAYMAEEGEYLPNYSYWIENGPLHRNTKPPFTTWLQALFMKVFGIHELSLRIPVALLVLATVFLLVYFAKKSLGNIYIGYCAGFVLVTSGGYIRDHAARTGDQDAALAFYMLAGILAFYHYLRATGKKQQHFWLAVLTLSLIFSSLTKYIFGLMFLPAFFLYALYQKQLANIVSRASVWLAVLFFVAVTGGWLAIMEYRLPGFVERAFFYEMFDRYATVIEDHVAPWHYYFTKQYEDSFTPWLYLLPVPLVLLFWKGLEKPLRDIIILMSLCAGTLLTAISFSQTKTTHYDVPAYPALAFLAGAGLYWLCRWAWSFGKKNRYYRVAGILAVALLIAIFIVQPYANTLKRTYMPRLENPEEQYGYLFRKITTSQPEVRSFKLLHSGFDGQAIFYAGLLNRKKGYDIKLSINPEQVKEGEVIMTCDKRTIDYLFQKFELQGLETHQHCFLAVVKGKKQQQ